MFHAAPGQCHSFLQSSGYQKGTHILNMNHNLYSSNPSGCTTPHSNRSTLEAFCSWKTLAWQKRQRGRHFSQHEAHAGAQFFLRRSTHACVARTLRPLCTAVERDRMAIPTRRQPSMRGLPHIAKNFELELLEARSGDGLQTDCCQPSNERQSRTRSVARSLTTSIPAHLASGKRPEFRKARCAHHFWSQKCRRLHPLRWELHVLAHLQSSGSVFKTSAEIPSGLSFPSSMFSTVVEFARHSIFRVSKKLIQRLRPFCVITS